MIDMVQLSVVAVRGAIVLGAALAVLPLLKRASAATRRLVLAAALSAVVALPLVSALGPSLRVPHLVAPAPHAFVAATNDEPTVTGTIAHEAKPTTPTTQPTTRHASISARSPIHFSHVFSAIWALGAIVVLARLVGGMLRTRRLVRDAKRINVLRSNGRVVEVRATAAIETPAVAGVLRPVILVPLDAAQWTPERRLVVLMHELAHVERHDCLAQLVAQLACALHWFDPLVWMAAKRLRLERELAADDRVLDRGVRPSSYAEHLLALATSDVDTPSGALAMAQRSQIESRIVALLGAAKHGALGRSGAALICATVGGLAFVVACAGPDRAKPLPTAEHATTSSITNPSRKAGVSKDQIAKMVGADPARVQLTLDEKLQAMAEEETDRLTVDGVKSSTLIALDPRDGAILAMTSRSDDPSVEVAVQKLFVPGSTMKSFTVAAAIDAGVLREDDTFDCSPTAQVHDWKENGTLDVTHILALSSNVGAVKIFDRLGPDRLQSALVALHFGDVPRAQFPDAASGELPCMEKQGEEVAMGAAATATPLQVAGAFAALADGGVYHAPSIVRRVLGFDGRTTFELESTGNRVFSDDAAKRTMRLLENAMASDDSTAKAARIDGVRVAGKTGTAELPHADGVAPTGTYASFVGAVPADAPRLVVLIGAEVTCKDAGGGKIAAPVFARFVSRALPLLDH